MTQNPVVGVMLGVLTFGLTGRTFGSRVALCAVSPIALLGPAVLAGTADAPFVLALPYALLTMSLLPLIVLVIFVFFSLGSAPAHAAPAAAPASPAAHVAYAAHAAHAPHAACAHTPPCSGVIDISSTLPACGLNASSGLLEGSKLASNSNVQHSMCWSCDRVLDKRKGKNNAKCSTQGRSCILIRLRS